MAPLNILGSLFGSDWARKADEAYQRGELERAARFYRKAGRAEQAGRLLHRLGRTDEAVEAFREGGLHLQAAQLLSDEERHKDALQAFEEAGAHRLAAESALRLQQPLRAARLFEKAQMEEKAVEHYLQAGELAASLRCLNRILATLGSEDHTSLDVASEDRKRRRVLLRKADILERIGHAEEAGEILLDLGDAARAATLLARAGRAADAARALHEIGLHRKALEILDEESDADPFLRARLLSLGSQPEEAARLWEELGRDDEAAAAWEEAREWASAAAAWQRAGDSSRAAELLSKAGRPREAAEAFSESGLHDRAAEAFRKAGDTRRAAEAWVSAGNNLRAGEAFLEAGDTLAARDALQAVETEQPDYARATALLLPLLLDEGLVEGARHRFELARGTRGWDDLSTTERQYWQARLAEADGRVEDAGKLYQRVLAEKSRYRDASSRLQALEERRHTPSEPMTDTVPLSRTDGDAPSAEIPSAPTSPSARREDHQSGTFVSFVDLGALPWNLGETATPWWPGTQIRDATHRRTGEPATLVLADLPASDERRKRIRKDIRRVVGLQHGSVLELRDVVLTEDRAVLVYAPFAGTTLERRLTQSRIDPLGAIAVLSRIAEALGQIHKLGQSHGWLSPRTILIEEGDRAVLAGVGLSRVLGVEDPVRRAYLAPEAAEELEDALSPAGDLYSLGLLGVELLRAMLPVGRAEPRIDPRQVGWSADVEEIVPKSVRNELLRCLAQEPLERPSIAELRSALGSIGLIPGQLLAGRYEILGELGQGGMSRVYRARDRDLAEEVAIKTVLTPALGRAEDEDRLLREVQICRRITHPNVVRVHDFGRFSQGIFIIMEILEGPGLDHLIVLSAPMNLRQARKVLREIAAALAEAHRLHIVHRDLKPGNVILADGRFKVLDFGIARSTDGTGSQLTRTGEVVGSPLFMAPEQIQGRELTGRCDLYALGVIAFTILVGREPFRGETPTAVVLQHLHEAPPDLRELRPDLPAEWDEVVRRLLQKDPEDRFGSADELLEALATLPIDDGEETFA